MQLCEFGDIQSGKLVVLAKEVYQLGILGYIESCQFVARAIQSGQIDKG